MSLRDHTGTASVTPFDIQHDPAYEVLLKNLSQRNLQPELMDDPEIDPDLHRQALAGLARLNRFSNSSGILWSEIRRFANAKNLTSLKVLDVACGGGDVSIGLAARARTSHIKLQVTGVDISATAIETARQSASAGFDNVRFEICDVFNETLSTGFDIVVCSLFLHHLSEPQAQLLLSKMFAHSQRLMLVNDLRRSTAGYWLAQLACRTLSRSPIVHVDGPRSVEGAFSLPETRQLCISSGVASESASLNVMSRWPFRFLISAAK